MSKQLTLKTKLRGMWMRFAILLMAMLITTSHEKLMAQTPISNETELKTLLENGGSGYLTNDIIVTEVLHVDYSTTVTLNGSGYILSVPITGSDAIGVLNADASDFTMLNNDGNLSITNMTLRGGRETCIINYGTLKMVGCTIERSGSADSSGGGLENYSLCYLKNCKLSRNNANYGGGFLNEGSSSVFVFDCCSINENRSLSSSGGGGGGQNNGYLIVNNCTFANNTSTEIGGAINQCGGDTYVLNTTFVGNISDSDYGPRCGGAVGINGGSFFAVNSLIVNNYAKSDDDFIDCDLGLFSGYPELFYKSGFGAVCNFSGPTPTGDWPDSKNVNTDNNFASYLNSSILNPDGTSSGRSFYRPAILQCSNGTYIAPIKTGSEPTTGGVVTYLSLPDDVSTFSTSTIKLGYGEIPTAIGDFALADVSDKVTTYQDETERADGVIGSVGPVPPGTEYATLTLRISGNGTVSGGGSLYGDTYPKGTHFTLTATPNAGGVFSRWIVNGSINVTDNPYEFDLNSNIEVMAVFPVCKNLMTNVMYGTVQAAVNAAASGETIQMITNSSENLTIASDDNITLDLNGKVLKSGGQDAPVISNAGNLTIIDSDKTAKHYYTVSWSGLWEWNDGNSTDAVNIENLTARPAEQSVVCICGGAITGGKRTGVVNNGTLAFNGGCIVGNEYTWWDNCAGLITTGEATIDGGYVVGNVSLEQPSAGVYVDGGNLTFNSGMVSFNRVRYSWYMDNSGGISVDNEGSVTMNGGAISYNLVDDSSDNFSCGGLCVYNGSFIMNNGIITNNSAGNQHGGASVKTGSMTVGGTARITGNIGSNLYLNNGITVTASTSTPLATGAMIGVTTKATPTAETPVGVTASTNETNTKYFNSDNPEYFVVYRDGAVKLVGATAINVDTGKRYLTVQSAIDEAESGQTVNMLANSTENVTIESDDDLTLDLNGFVLNGNDYDGVIYNEGTLSVVDNNTSRPVHYFTYKEGDTWSYLPSHTPAGTDVNFEDMGTAELVSGTTVIAIKGGCITGGSCYNGAAIDNENGEVELTDINIVGNHSECLAGGVYVGPGVELTLTNVLFAGNRTGAYGGAICNDGTLTATNCIFNYNFNPGDYDYGNGAGGAISSDGIASFTNCTFKNNIAYRGGAISCQG